MSLPKPGNGENESRREDPVSVGEAIALVIAIMLLVYLAYALLRPERF
jgi:K+-transporting ATPase KdpF subunit